MGRYLFFRTGCFRSRYAGNSLTGNLVRVAGKAYACANPCSSDCAGKGRTVGVIVSNDGHISLVFSLQSATVCYRGFRLPANQIDIDSTCHLAADSGKARVNDQGIDFVCGRRRDGNALVIRITAIQRVRGGHVARSVYEIVNDLTVVYGIRQRHSRPRRPGRDLRARPGNPGAGFILNIVDRNGDAYRGAFRREGHRTRIII